MLAATFMIAAQVALAIAMVWNWGKSSIATSGNASMCRRLSRSLTV